MPFCKRHLGECLRHSPRRGKNFNISKCFKQFLSISENLLSVVSKVKKDENCLSLSNTKIITRTHTIFPGEPFTLPMSNCTVAHEKPLIIVCRTLQVRTVFLGVRQSSGHPLVHAFKISQFSSIFFIFFCVFSQNLFFSLSVILVWVSADTRTPTCAVSTCWPMLLVGARTSVKPVQRSGSVSNVESKLWMSRHD